MTITLVGEVAGGRSASNDSGKRKYERKFKLKTNSELDGPYAIGSHAGLPVIGNVHPEDSNAYCRSISITNSDPWAGWEAAYSYSDERSFDKDDPEADEVLLTWSTEPFEELILYDVNTNEAILNSALDPFSDPPTREADHLIVSFQANVRTVPPWVLGYRNTINSDSINVDGLNIGIGLAKMTGLGIGARELRGGIYFYPLSYSIKIKPEGWAFEPLDAGFRKRAYSKAGGYSVIDCVDAEFKPVSEPVGLDGNGDQLFSPIPSDFVFLNFDIYKSMPFSLLPGISS